MGDVELRNLRYQLGSEDSIHVDCLDAGETFQVCDPSYHKSGNADLFLGYISLL
jgi:hypothetical protein